MRLFSLSLPRSTYLVVALVGIFYSSLSHALGLGEISLKSNLNEPLNAEIRLLKVRDLSKEQILVDLASRQDFSRAGVERIFFLNDLSFDVFLDNPSYPYIRVTSSKPVTEPYLNFLINVQWPTGRLIREYTLLLDLPVFEQGTQGSIVEAPLSEPVARSQAVESIGAGSSVVEEVVTGDVVQTPARVERTIPDTPPGSYRVQNGDTLWEIADRFLPQGGFTVNQTMLAIQRANPEAFSGDNINRLQSGRVLRFPDAEEIGQLGRQQASEEVNRQARVWRGEEPAFADQGAALTGTTPATGGAGTDQALEGRLSLGSADVGESNVQGTGSSGAGEALQNELAIANEELDRRNRENSELKARISDLEEQVSTMEELIKVSNDQLKALELSLQNQASEADQNLSGQPDEATTELSSDGDAATTGEGLGEVETPVLSDEGLDTNIEPTPNVTVEPTPVVTVEPTPIATLEPTPIATPEPEVTPEATSVSGDIASQVSSFADNVVKIVKDNLQLVLGGLAGLLLLLLLLFRLGRSKEEDDFEGFDEFDEGIFDEENPEELDEDSFVDNQDEDFEEDLESVEAETEDVVAEADIYISLGQQDKALELLQKEIQQNPANSEARLGMLKIYAADQNVEAFDDQYAQLLPLGDIAAIQQAKALREQIGGVQPFDTENYSLGDIDDENLDIDESELIAELNDGAQSETTLEDDFSFDSSVGESLDELEELDTDINLEGDIGLNDLESFTGESAENPIDDFGELDLDLDADASLDELDLDLDADASLDELDLDEDLEGLKVDLDSSDTNEINLDLDEIEEISELNDLSSDQIESVNNELKIDAEGLDFDLDTELDLTASDDDLNLPDSDDSPEVGSLLESEDDLPIDLDDLEELDLSEEESIEMSSLDEGIGEAPLPASPGSDTNQLNFDEPPIDLDIDDLDKEIDEMTSLLDATPENESLMEDELSQQEDTIEALNEDSLPDLDDFDANDSVQESPQNDEEVSFEEDSDDSFLSETDEVATKLDLARAYLDMGDTEGAGDILQEVLEEGNQTQKDEAKSLLTQV